MPETRSGRPGSGQSRKRNPVKLAMGVAAVAVVAVGVGWGLTHLPGAGPGGGPSGPRGGGGRGGGRANITVGVAPANVGAIPIQLDALGVVTPPVTAAITSRIAGQLMAVYFTEGQLVKKGEKLALIDPRPYRVALEQAQGQLAKDEAALNQARVDLKRYQTLLAQNSIAAQQVDVQDALVKQDEGAVKVDQANVENARLNLQYTTITAPVAGRVGLRQVDVGNYINAASQALLVITQVDPIDVVFTAPEDDVPRITARQRAGAALPATVFDRGGGEVLGQGKLSTLDNQIDVSTGTVKAKARFDNGSGALFPNQFVNVRLLVDVLCNVVVAPATAVRHGSQGDYVFTVGPDRIAHMAMVTTGPGAGETVSIVKGLNGGETLITEGGDRLRDGSQVNLPGQAPSGGSRRHGGFRRGGQGGKGPAGAAVAPPDADTRARAQGEAIPAPDVPPDACSKAGKGKLGQGAALGGWRHGQFGPGPGAGGFPPGGGFHRRGRGQGADQPAAQGQGG